MKLISISILLIVILIGCSEKETTYRNASWDGANGIIKPDTLAKVIQFNPNDFDMIFRSSLNYPNFPENDPQQLKYVFASHFKKGKDFGSVNSFKLNNEPLTFFQSAFYPSYIHIAPAPFSFQENVMNIEFIDKSETYNYEFEVNDVFESLVVPTSTLASDIELTFDKKWEFYSVHAFLYFTEENEERKAMSLNRTYEIITSVDNKLLISKSEIEDIIFRRMGASLNAVNRVSFIIAATDTSHFQINDKKGLLYKNAERVLNFNYSFQ
jgi:hypothetical protein